MNPPRNSSLSDFCSGLVFGFDVGTGSIGYAVRRGDTFLDVGVLICPEETSRLDTRRGLRSQRRRLRNRQRVREWFSKQLEAFGLPSPYLKTEDGRIQFHPRGQSGAGQPVLKPGLDNRRICNPVLLRCEAVEGPLEKPEELHAALTHLWKLRGKTNVPWKQEANDNKSDEQKKEEERNTAQKLRELEQAMKTGGFKYPCQLLLYRQQHRIKQREEVWPRDEFQNQAFNLKQEFLAILEAQSPRFQKLAGKVTYLDNKGTEQTVSAAEWLLYGDTRVVIRHGQERRVYFKTTECENPGVLGLRWPRFDNRNPGLDLLVPFDRLGRPIHVVRKNKDVFLETQWEQALFNFRVIDKTTGAKVLPDAASLSRLRQIYETSKRPTRRPKKPANTPADSQKAVEIKITESVLSKWAAEFANQYELIADQPDLVSRTGDGRAKFSTATLRNLRRMLETLSTGLPLDSVQPLLRDPSGSKNVAMQKFLGSIRHGLVRHRLSLFLRLLRRLVREQKSKPDFIVVEAVRSLAFSTKRKEEHLREQRKNRQEREGVYQKLKDEKQAASEAAILRYRLAVEAGFKCPFCLDTFTQADLYNADVDISHLYPKSLAPCDESYNLTVAHARCNRTDMEAKTPREAFGESALWPSLAQNARDRFHKTPKKLQLFLAETREKAEALIESKAPLAATAYISKMLRRLCLIELEWLGEDGRDPTNKEGNIPSMRFLVTNGEITSRLRQAWELNGILHPAVPDLTKEEWRNLSPEERQAYKAAKRRRFEKNRGDHRHHALDAMVIACTWPAYAQRVHNATKDWQDKGWWHLDAVKNRLIARHPIFTTFEPMRLAAAEWMARLVAENRVQHHASQSRHVQAYRTSFFSQRPNPDSVGEHFYLMREKLTDISPKDLRLRKVHPPALSEYLFAAWKAYLDKLCRYIERTAGSFFKTLDTGTNAKQAAKEFQKRLQWSDFLAWLQDESREPALAPQEAETRIVLNPKTPPEFRKDDMGAWMLRMPEPEKLLKTVPEDFQRRVCFAHYQQWSMARPAQFTFPAKVRIPIVRVRYRQPVNDNSVAIGPKSIPGWGGGNVYVKRGELREVRLMPYAHGPGVVPVFVPYSKQDKPFSNYEFSSGAKPLMVLRKRGLVRFVNDYSPSYPAGHYITVVLGESVAKFALPHVANTPEARLANGFPKSGLQAKWHLLIAALGFDFPKELKVSESDVEPQEEDEQNEI